MNKKKLAIIITVSIILLLSLGYCIVGKNAYSIPKELLPDVDQFKVGKALTALEFTAGEIARRRNSIVRNMAYSKEDHWDEVEKAFEEYNELEEQFFYRKDTHRQLYLIHNLERYGISLFGYVFSPLWLPYGLKVDYEPEIEKQKNKVELLRENLIRKKFELRDLISKRDINLRHQIERLLQNDERQQYDYEREILMETVTFYKLKKGSSLEILPSWEEGEHRLSNFERLHVWIGMYNTEKPGIDNYIGSFTTDEFTSDMNQYWEEALKKNKDTKSIRIKWIYVSEEHKIVWEGNKNEKEEWYTFAKYEGEPAEGMYDVVNMNLLNYPDFQQYYVVSYRPKKSFIIII